MGRGQGLRAIAPPSKHASLPLEGEYFFLGAILALVVLCESNPDPSSGEPFPIEKFLVLLLTAENFRASYT